METEDSGRCGLGGGDGGGWALGGRWVGCRVGIFAGKGGKVEDPGEITVWLDGGGWGFACGEVVRCV